MKIVALALFVCVHFVEIGGIESVQDVKENHSAASEANKIRNSKNLEQKEINKFNIAGQIHTNTAPSIKSSVMPSLNPTEKPESGRRLSFGYVVSDCAHISCTAHYSSGFATNGPLNNTVSSIYAVNDLTYSAPLMVSASSFLLSMSAGQLFLVDSSGQVLKQYSTGIANEYITPAIGSDGSIYVPGSDTVYAFSADGNTKWNTQMNGYTFQSSPTISQTGVLYIAGFNQGAKIGSVTAFNTLNGTTIWSTAISNSSIQSSSPIISPVDGSIYIGCLDGNLYSLSSYGTVNWHFTTNSTIYSTPSFDNTKNIYFGAESGYLYKLSSGGSLIWNFNTNHVILASASISDSDQVVYISADISPMLSYSILYALSTTSGLQLYSVTLTGITYYSSIPAVSSNNYVYINTYDPATTTGYTYCVTATGSILWNYKVNNDEYFTSPILSSDGILYTISALGKLYKFDNTNHSTSTQTSVMPSAQPAMSNTHPSVISHSYAASPCPHLLCSPTYSSYFYTSGPSTNDTHWSTSISIDSFSSPLFNSIGSIVITGSLGDILLLSANNGSISHHYHVQTTVFGTPAVSYDNTIYIPGNNTVFALRPDGTFKWIFLIPDPNLNIYSSITLSESGYLYVATHRHILNGNCPVYSISTTDGSLQWTFNDPKGSFVSSSPVIRSDGVIYVGNMDKNMYAITSYGSLLWAFATGNEIYGTAALDSDDNVYFGSTDSYVYKTNPHGSVIWQFKTLYSVISSPSIGEDGTVFCVSSDTVNVKSVLYSIDGSTGDQKYRVVNSNYISYYSSAPSVGLDNTVYITLFDQANGDTKLQAITSSGSVQWSFNTDQDYFWSSPIINSEGDMYVTSVRGKIYAFTSGPSTQPSLQPSKHPLCPSRLPSYYPSRSGSSITPTNNYTEDSTCYCPFTQVDAIWTKDSSYPTG